MNKERLFNFWIFKVPAFWLMLIVVLLVSVILIYLKWPVKY